MTKRNWHWDVPQDGVYFGMSFDDYLAMPCLQSSSIKTLLMNPSRFWSESWMNPYSDKHKKDKKHYADGRAYHARILEGQAVYDEQYLVDLDKDDLGGDVLRNSDDIRRALRDAGLKTNFVTKSTGIERLLKAKPHARVLDVMLQKHRADKGNRELVSAQTDWEIQQTTRTIEHHPELKYWLAGGYPEVTIIFTDPNTGIPFKIRVDYLKINNSVDLKTFENSRNLPVERAIKYSIENYLYHVQAWLYMTIINQAREMVKAGKVIGAVENNIPPEWLEAFSNGAGDEFWFLCVEKNAYPPMTQGVKLTTRDPNLARVGEAYVTPAIENFTNNYKLFQENSWINIKPSTYITCNELQEY